MNCGGPPAWENARRMPYVDKMTLDDEIAAVLDLHRNGRLGEAEAGYRALIGHGVNSGGLLSNLAAICLQTARAEESIGLLEGAIILEPDLAHAHYNLGQALYLCGRIEDAIAAYRKAIGLNPDFADAHNNLGIALHGTGRPEEALAVYRRAIEINPNSGQTYNNLGMALLRLARFDEALTILKKSMEVEDSVTARMLLADCLPYLGPGSDDGSIRETFVRAISEPWTAPEKLAPAAARFVERGRHVADCVKRAVEAWPLRLPKESLYGEVEFANLIADSLLMAILEAAPICSANLEKFLTMGRRCLLAAAVSGYEQESADTAALRFYTALARQCFINEYVFGMEATEAAEAASLRAQVAADIEASASISEMRLIATAAYFPLHSLPGAERLTRYSWSQGTATLIGQQVENPIKEQRYRVGVTRLTPVEDAVSRLVQSQYEEDPYPRWIKLSPSAGPTAVEQYIRKCFPMAALTSSGIGQDADVLIAGCGTGRQAIERARDFPHARTLAIDLSLSSLAYAKRKTDELRLANIEYGHADLLRLDLLGRTFDIIESHGVLHHLADPWAGWRSLVSLLRPKGVMFLGFYSARARRGVTKMRTTIANHGYGHAADEIRRFRQDVVGRKGDGELGWLLGSVDFFTMSGCRDLLFHVQEHQMTLPDINAFLVQNGLRFLGFTLRSDLLQAYQRRFPNDPAATNLAYWEVFEHENPDTFAGMYQFGVQKA